MKKALSGILSLSLLLLGCSSALAEEKNAGRLLYQGHGSLRIVTGEGKVIYVDPYAGDGYDLPADLIRIILKVKGADKVIVTSDACSICGCPPGEYSLWGNHAVLTADGKLYNPEKKCLVAAASTMEMCMNFLKSLHILSEEECIKIGRKNALALLKEGTRTSVN